jgi:hypothetical protein
MMNSSRTTQVFRSHPLNVRLAALTLLLLALVIPAGTALGQEKQAPDVGECQNLQVPAGNRLSSSVYAEGVQIYRWDGTTWVFVAPKAVLFSNVERAGGAIGLHYAGPTWESFTGSKVVGKVLQRCTADANAIPWLLLEGVHSEGPGIFDRVTYIQRVNTVGGKAPAEPGEFLGQVARIPYSAQYYFYRGRR